MEIDIDQYKKELLIACDCERLYLIAFVVPFSLMLQIFKCQLCFLSHKGISLPVRFPD